MNISLFYFKYNFIFPYFLEFSKNYNNTYNNTIIIIIIIVNILGSKNFLVSTSCSIIFEFIKYYCYKNV